MPTLFDVDHEVAGFRLIYLEMYNWGTFDQKIWRIAPEGKHSLLTGANGSGKTTLVDALLTLLVPTTKRFYNQSSGVENRRERDEKSYCLGAYGTLQLEDGASAKTQYLRTKDDYSILLACFRDLGFRQQVTLAQVRWFSNNELKKVFLFSMNPLTIQEHFIPVDSQGEWKRRLKSLNKTELFDTFTQYSQKFAKVFGLKSEKALNLFAHTVGIKVLGNFNEFIRTNMLEESEVEEEFKKLREHYNNLLSVHNTIEKAQAQLLLLEPIIERGRQFEILRRELQQIDDTLQIVPAYFAQEKVKLLTAATKAKQEEAQRLEAALAERQEESRRLEAQRTDLEIALSKDETGEQIRNLEREIHHLEKERDAKRRKAEEYHTLAKELHYPLEPSEEAFYATLTRAQEQKIQIEAQFPQVHEQWSDYRGVQNTYKEQSKALLDELRSLEGRRNQIPLPNIAMRKGILAQLQLAEAQIPFVGELIRVKHSAKAWESAIERLLHNLGLILLVPEQYYRQVNHYVNTTDLQGRIVYYRVDPRRVPEAFEEDLPHSLLSKLDINPQSEFHDWVAAHLRTAYNYVCTDNLDEFQRYEKALTKAGLIKTSVRHEKDDRPHVLNQSNYILGWDNQAKMELIQAKRRDLEKQMQQNLAQLKQVEAQREKLSQTRDRLNKLLGFTSFYEIDWQKPVLAMQQLLEEKEQIKESSDQLQELETQLQHVRDQLAAQKKRAEELGEQKIHLKRDMQEYQRQLAENTTLLQAFAHINLADYFPKLEPYLPSATPSAATAVRPDPSTSSGRTVVVEGTEPTMPLTLTNIAEYTQTIRSNVSRRLEEKRAEQAKFELTLVRRMHTFKFPAEDILQKYPTWTVDTVDLEDTPDALGEYDALYRRIKAEDLPKHEQRFKTWLNERVIVNFASFAASLDKQLKTIKESVKELNESLKQIKFHTTPPTYIQIDSKEVRDRGETGVTTFRQALREVFANVSKLHEARELEVSFHKIKAIVENLTNDEAWRKKITDVRNWLEFGAIEKHCLDDSPKQYYDDSQGLSGGEKAKLAYTILASAIAYQFGINQRAEQFQSFRFVVVDEAFSKVDPENARFAMDLFKQLNLQLMVVTPLDKINIAEQYISSVHYVENKHRQTSAVYDLTLQEYQERKEALKQAAM